MFKKKTEIKKEDLGDTHAQTKRWLVLSGARLSIRERLLRLSVGNGRSPAFLSVYRFFMCP